MRRVLFGVEGEQTVVRVRDLETTRAISEPTQALAINFALEATYWGGSEELEEYLALV